MLLDGRRYAYKSGDDDPGEEAGCTIVDATVALACAQPDVTLAVQAKREVGRLWDDIEKPPYTHLFNSRTSAVEVWRAVEIMRTVDKELAILRDAPQRRADMIAVHGNRFILHRMFQDEKIKGFRADSADMGVLKISAIGLAKGVFERLAQILETTYADAYLAVLFKNPQKCRDLATKLDAPMEPSETETTLFG